MGNRRAEPVELVLGWMIEHERAFSAGSRLQVAGSAG
jgi:hypothetical protein